MDGRKEGSETGIALPRCACGTITISTNIILNTIGIPIPFFEYTCFHEFHSIDICIRRYTYIHVCLKQIRLIFFDSSTRSRVIDRLQGRSCNIIISLPLFFFHERVISNLCICSNNASTPCTAKSCHICWALLSMGCVADTISAKLSSPRL